MDDIKIAKAYTKKFNRAQNSGHEFDLSFTSFKNMMNAKRCQLTGVELTDQEGKYMEPTDRTVDRIDSSKGYVKGNVMVVCHEANQFKSLFENPNNNISTKQAIKIIKGLK